jgi:tetratricopeptide (TPR) repeat protein
MSAERGVFHGRLAARLRPVVLGLGSLVCVALTAAPARAQSAADSATAQALFDRAKRLMAEGNYADACPVLEESKRIEPRSGTRVNLADCYERTSRYASAWSMFLNAAALAKGNNPEREAVARDRAAALVPRLSNLVITAPSAAATPGLEITRDGVRVGQAQLGLPLPADGGEHTIVARAPGRRSWQTKVTLRPSGQTANVRVPDLEPAPPEASSPTLDAPTPSDADAPARETPPSEPPRSRFTPGVIVGTALTSAFAAGTVVTGVLYNGKNQDYERANEQLAPNRGELHSEVKTLGVVNLALLGGTALAAGVTVYLLVRGPSASTGTSARIELRGSVMPGVAVVSVGGRL